MSALGLLHPAAAQTTYFVNGLQCPDTVVTLTGGNSTNPTALTPLSDIPGFNTSGTTLLVGPGEYLINALINLPGDAAALCIIGQGASRADVVLRSTVPLDQNDFTKATFTMLSGSSLGLAGLVLDGGNVASGLYVAGTPARLEVENVTLTKLQGGVGGPIWVREGSLNAVNAQFVGGTGTGAGAVLCDGLSGNSQATFTGVSVACSAI